MTQEASPTDSGFDTVTSEQRTALRELARRYADLAASEENQRRIRLWKGHNALRPERPMILIFPEGGWNEIVAVEPALRCLLPREHPLHLLEWQLRSDPYAWHHFQCDNVLAPELPVGKVIWDTGWGVDAHWIWSDSPGGARKFDPVILEPSDLAKLKHPEVRYDAEASARNFALAQELIGDLMPVKLRGVCHFSCHFMAIWTSWRGLEETMMDMVAEPEFLHDAMAFMRDGYQGLLRQYTAHDLLDLNNDNTYHSSGGNGWTDELPAAGYDPAHVRPCDMWASAESQELTLVSPRMHQEFALDYEAAVLEPFGLTGYACCDDLTLKLDRVKQIANMRRISIAPVAQIERCAPQLGPDYILSWKPNPTHLVGEFSPDKIRHYLRRGLEAARENRCVIEMILKDTHTCENHPERFDRWSEIAREEVERDLQEHGTWPGAVHARHSPVAS